MSNIMWLVGTLVNATTSACCTDTSMPEKVVQFSLELILKNIRNLLPY